ncbi:MAG: dihydroorotase [Clostridiales bacterium]|nr:dihydroorotase [Clostridiales bacterium]
MRICVRDGYVIDPASNYEGVGTIWIENGAIAYVETENGVSGAKPLWAGSGGHRVINAKGKWVMPGLVDLHVHLREPGFAYKEDIASGCRAAKKGGFTKICCMPNTNPVTDCREVVSYIRERAAEVDGIEVFVVGAATKGQMGTELADIEGMAEAGIRAVSEDGKSVMNSRLMRDAMAKAKELGLPFFSHAEDESLAGTPIGEELIVARDILLAGETGCRLHLCHVSTAGSVRLIRMAKEGGADITAETAPHYFTLDESGTCENPNRKMNPPLRSARDVAAIRSALKDGTIDAIATDHAPHARHEKEAGFADAPYGVIGLETSFAVSYTMLVRTGILTPIELVSKMSSAPAEILGEAPPSLSAGAPAGIVIADVEEEYVICSEEFASKSANSPFSGMRAFGRPALLSEFWG